MVNIIFMCTNLFTHAQNISSAAKLNTFTNLNMSFWMFFACTQQVITTVGFVIIGEHHFTSSKYYGPYLLPYQMKNVKTMWQCGRSHLYWWTYSRLSPESATRRSFMDLYGTFQLILLVSGPQLCGFYCFFVLGRQLFS